MFSSRNEIGRARMLLGGYVRDAQRADNSRALGSVGASMGELLKRAGVSEKERRKLGVQTIVAVIGCLVLASVTGRILFAYAAGAVVLLQYVEVRRRIHRRVESFEKDYTALLLSLASSIRTGLDPIVAFCKSADLFREESEMHRQLQGVRATIDSGASEEVAIRGFASSIPHPDIDLFRAAFLLARREGSSLGHCLERLARVTRQRQSFRRKIRSAVAMQKLSAFGIAGSALAIALIQGGASPEALQTTLQNPLGVKILIFGGTLIIGGLAWMLHMTRARV